MAKEKAQTTRFNILAADFGDILTMLRVARLCLDDNAPISKKLGELMYVKKDMTANSLAISDTELAASLQKAAKLDFSDEEREDIKLMLKISARFDTENYRPAARKILTVAGIVDYSQDFKNIPGLPQTISAQNGRTYREERSTLDTGPMYVPSEWEWESARES